MLIDNPALPGRAGGILLHPTSLPGSYGIGDLGPGALTWVDWLAAAGCRLWQVLPLGPTGYADSPYQGFSAFASNHLLISPEMLCEQGLLFTDEIENIPHFPEDTVDYGQVIPWKDKLLDVVAAQFTARANPSMLDDYLGYCQKHQPWLDDFSMFMALKSEYGGQPWTAWPEALRDRNPTAIQDARKTFSTQIQGQAVRQYLFSSQWASLREAARLHGITMIGDLPLFVAHDSADVWSHPDLFYLDPAGHPEVVAGVPPDYFSATGQRWGNPLYNWSSMQENGFEWWIRRFRQALSLVDVVRVDHFRGLEAYWEIPGFEQTAEHGRWVPGPRHALLDCLQEALGGLPVIAEDLGIITNEVVELRKAYYLPGMKVMQFGFEGGPDDDFLPHRYEEACVAYTGTHDNDTSVGWYQKAEPGVQDFCRRYLSSDGKHIAWDMIDALWGSLASWTIVPLQDPLELGSEARMNFPGRTHGNWNWRISEKQLHTDLARRLLELNRGHGR
ncbi:MAG: 4-alpha-glucanotransferase [Anaerolineales bacterium]|nr:MAG: 4-alpha-glucanotransferase [Anaerolineales bacterium]